MQNVENGGYGLMRYLIIKTTSDVQHNGAKYSRIYSPPIRSGKLDMGWTRLRLNLLTRSWFKFSAYLLESR